MTKEDYINKLESDFGLSKRELSGKSEEELELLLQKKSKERVCGLANIIKSVLYSECASETNLSKMFDAEAAWKRIVQNESNVFVVHEQLEELIHKFDTSDIMMMLEKYAVNEEMYQRLYKMYRVKLRQYQEEMLYEIETLCKKLPEEERFMFLNTLERDRENIPRLKNMLLKIQDKKHNELLLRIAQNKEHILKNYFPQDYEEEYRHYFEIRQLKNELIDKILKSSSFYNSEDLNKKSVDELKEVIEFIDSEKARQKKEREAYKRFMKMIEEVSKKENINKELSSIVGMMTMELSREQIKKVIDDAKELNLELGEMLDATLLRSLHEKSNRFKKSR